MAEIARASYELKADLWGSPVSDALPLYERLGAVTPALVLGEPVLTNRSVAKQDEAFFSTREFKDVARKVFAEAFIDLDTGIINDENDPVSAFEKEELKHEIDYLRDSLSTGDMTYLRHRFDDEFIDMNRELLSAQRYLEMGGKKWPSLELAAKYHRVLWEDYEGADIEYILPYERLKELFGDED